MSGKYTYDDFGNRFDADGNIVIYGDKPERFQDDFGNTFVTVRRPPETEKKSKRASKKKKAGRKAGRKVSGVGSYCSKCRGPHVYKHGKA